MPFYYFIIVFFVLIFMFCHYRCILGMRKSIGDYRIMWKQIFDCQFSKARGMSNRKNEFVKTKEQ